MAGNGQLVRGQSYSTPLTVLLVNGCGQPVPNVPVTWTTNVSMMRYTGTVTGSDGQVSNQWLAPQILMGWASWTSGTVTATASGLNVTFYLTAYYLDSHTSIPSVGAKVLSPVLGQILSGNAGEPANGAVRVSVTAQQGFQTGQPVPYVQAAALSDGASASILEGLALTDASGVAAFMPMLGGQPGPASPFSVDVGGLFEFTQALQFQVTGVALPTDEFFVSQLYRDLLSRAPDAGLSYWVAALGNDSMTRASVAAAFFGGAEFTANAQFVYDVYQGILGRDADFAGWQYWDARMESGAMSQSAIIDTFLGSAEYAQDFGANPDNAAFVVDLYRTALRREPDVDGLSFWVDLLNGSALTRAQVVESFLSGDEFQSRMRNLSNLFLIYFGFLRRDPDTEGGSYWLDQLNAGLPLTDAINAFISSPEYLDRF